MSRALLVDAGGSTIRFAYGDSFGQRVDVERVVHPHETYAHLASAINAYLEKHRRNDLSCVVIGAAGRIDRDRVQLCNNPTWPAFDAFILGEQLGVPVYLHNDLVAAAAAIPAFGDSDVAVLRQGVGDAPSLDAPRMMATLSTGVNAATLFPQSASIDVFVAGETGHNAFPPRDETEMALLRWATERATTRTESPSSPWPFVSFEDLISGSRGFETVVTFVQEVEGIPLLPETTRALGNATFAAPVISDAALNHQDPAALRALEIMGPIIGSYLAHVALAMLPVGGIYLMGGVSNNEALMSHFFCETGLCERMSGWGRLASAISTLPIYRVTCAEVGLVGAGEIARQHL